jgi:hypothetical protein
MARHEFSLSVSRLYIERPLCKPLRLFDALQGQISGDSFGTIAFHSQNGFVEMSFVSSLRCA